MADVVYTYSWFYDFENFKIASNKWNITYHGFLKNFSLFCSNNYSENLVLSQSTVDEWCKQRDTENVNSWRRRLYFMIALLKYGNARNYISIELPELPMIVDKTVYKPHAFTEKELQNFFYACDNIEVVRNLSITKMRKLMMPIVFRLLYSTGMRPVEVINLHKDDINLENGIVNIRKSKGYNQHYIVLHDSMLELIKYYENEIEKIYPNRTFFFPSKNDSHFSCNWISYNFKKLWYKYNTACARAYDLRHNYAIENIMSWTNAGIEFNSKILALSKSMGHSKISHTMYYFTAVPALYDKLEYITGKTFDELIPEVPDYENE